MTTNDECKHLWGHREIDSAVVCLLCGQRPEEHPPHCDCEFCEADDELVDDAGLCTSCGGNAYLHPNNVDACDCEWRLEERA